MKHNGMTAKNRPNRAGRQPVTMKGRQRVKENIRLFQTHMFFDLFDISENISVRENNAFGAAFCPRGE